MVGSGTTMLTLALLPLKVFTVTVDLPGARPSTRQVLPLGVRRTTVSLSVALQVIGGIQSVPFRVAFRSMDSLTPTVADFLSTVTPDGAALTVTAQAAETFGSALEYAVMTVLPTALAVILPSADTVAILALPVL